MDCYFKGTCDVFKEGLCLEGAIDKGECGGPLIFGYKIAAVGKINAGGKYRIAIISRCACGKFLGIVSGDKEPIFYRSDAVEISAVELPKIPQYDCNGCKKENDATFAFFFPKQAEAI